MERKGAGKKLKLKRDVRILHRSTSSCHSSKSSSGDDFNKEG